MSDSHHVVIVGGGTGGLTVASQLLEREDRPAVTVIDPADTHYYQPLWTLVGAGVFSRAESARPMSTVMPPDATWIQEAVTDIPPDQPAVTTSDGTRHEYDSLVVAAGLQLNWDGIPGLADAVAQPGSGVVSNYAYETCEQTWAAIQDFPAGGTALFTEPTMGIKCGGAPQKIAYLADDAFRRQGVRAGSDIAFMKAKPKLFSSRPYEKTLYDVVDRKGIDLHLTTELVEVRPDMQEAVFEDLDSGDRTAIEYDLLHAVPPMSAPDVVAESPLADDDGFVDVDPETLRHATYDNVFALGDNSNLPTSKTGAAIRNQAPVLVEHLMASVRESVSTEATYDGYTSCPLVTGYGKLVLAEFDYDKEPQESFPVDQTEERYSMYALKAYGLPRMYWHGMLKGRL